MTPPSTAAALQAPSTRRIVLVPREGRPDELVRRYRMARLRLDPRAPGDDRFAHLRRQHD